MTNYLFTGIILGLSAGFAPGPLLTLVVSETLQHDLRAGIKVALAPIITDLPIIVLTLLLLSKISHFQVVLGIISLLGGFFVLYLGYENMRTKEIDVDLHDRQSHSLRKGIIVNVLSPYPYLFWMSVGAPTTLKAMNQSLMSAVAFIGSFYVLLVGSKILLAVLVGRSRSFLTGRAYIYTMRILGLLLFVLALFLFRDSLVLLGLFQ